MKKAQFISLSNGPWLVTTIVIIVLVVGVGAVALNSFKTSSDTKSTSSAFYSDSEFTGINASYVDFKPTALVYDAEGNTNLIACSGTRIKNDSNNVDVTTNFTVSGCTARLDWVAYNNTAFHANFTYTYNVYKHAYNVSNQGEKSLSNFSLQMPTVGTMLGVGLILVVIIGIFAYLSKGKE